MKYYKVKTESDQVRYNKKSSDILIKNELYTKKQIDKMNLTDSFISKHFDIINEKPKNTYYLFGARFSY